METLLGIITGLGALLGLVAKVWFQGKDVKSLTAQIEAADARAIAAEKALKREQDANATRAEYENHLENAMREHLKACNTPLAQWASGLLRRTKDRN